MPVRAKTCSKCGEKKKLSEFHRNSARKDGLMSWCMSCSYQARVRDEVFEVYGRECVCCGTTENLTLDHVNANGAEHRELLGTGINFYAWLVQNGFPDECGPGGEYELQTLCSVCNSSKANATHCRMHCKHEECHPPVLPEPPARNKKRNLVTVALTDEMVEILDWARMDKDGNEISKADMIRKAVFFEWLPSQGFPTPQPMPIPQSQRNAKWPDHAARVRSYRQRKREERELEEQLQ